MTAIWPDPSPGGYYNWMFDEQAKGMEYLGGGEANAAVASLGPVVFRPRDILFIMVRVTSLSATGIPALRFNDDSLANYWDRNLTAANGSATWSEAAPAANTPVNSVRLGGVSATTGKVGMLVVMNRLANTKNLIGEMTTTTGAIGTIGALQILSGEWANTAEQIESVTLLNTGTGTLGVDSGFGVFGKNF